MIKTSETTLKLMPALLAARGKMNAAHKGKRNEHFRYNYANEESWHEAVQPHLLDHDLMLTFSCDSIHRVIEKYQTDKGDKMYGLTTITGSARVTHASGEWIEVCGSGEGSDNADKGAYKAMTGLKKYLYALMFALPTTDDLEETKHDDKRKLDDDRPKSIGEIMENQPDYNTGELNQEPTIEEDMRGLSYKAPPVQRPAPVRRAADPPGALEWTGYIKKKAAKPTSKGSTNHGFSPDGKMWFNTFDDDIAKLVIDSIEAAVPVKIFYDIQTYKDKTGATKQSQKIEQVKLVSPGD